MMTPFTPFPRILTIEDDFDDFFSNITDTVSPLSMYPVHCYDPFYSRRRQSKVHDKKYIISISLGHGYKIEDIKATLEGQKLKVSGSAVEITKNGKNQHQFEREYEIPEYVDLKTMQKCLCQDGTLCITFEKKVVEPKKEIEDLSKDSEFKMKIYTHGFKQEEISIKIVGRDLVIEASKKCESKSEGCKPQECCSRYFARTIRIGEEVDVDKLKVVKTSDDYLEISAPRDVAKLKPAERKLEIEK